MKYGIIMFERPYIMDFMVFQADFNIYYCIIMGTALCRGCSVTNAIAFILCFLHPYEFTPY